MTRIPCRLTDAPAPRFGLVVLQADETIEVEFRHLLPRDAELLVSRVPSGEEVTPESLQAMEGQLAAAAGLFPRGLSFDVVGYACTSGASQIGPGRVADRIRQGTAARAVTDPVTALVSACRRLGLSRLAILSPYVASVSARLRDVLAEQDIATPVFGSFEEAREANVVRIDGPSIRDAAETLTARGPVDGLFLSCTNLRTLGVIDPLEDALGLPVLSSNLVLAWHLLGLCGGVPPAGVPGRLMRSLTP